MRRTDAKKSFLILTLAAVLASCTTTSAVKPDRQSHQREKSGNTIQLLFGGDIMAHSENYNISAFEKIWQDVRELIAGADLAFANLEAPVDTSRPASFYPNFNMTEDYVKAAVDAGFDVFSLCNNHTNDQGLGGIRSTTDVMKQISAEAGNNGRKIWFAGLKDGINAPYTHSIIEANGWRILFLPVTELLNRQDYSAYINFVRTDAASRREFTDYLARLRQENPCDIFVLSLHTSEAEYIRGVTKSQDNFYEQILDAGVDILWANHAHIIKNRKIIVSDNGTDKIIMYACGNTISGQRRNPALFAEVPNGERDNTGDGLLYKVLLRKSADGAIKVERTEAHIITTYINEAGEFILKPLNQEFVDELYALGRGDWAKYLERRIKINENETKDLTEWR
ncbi:MAG: CapA family protein [Treponema sp.]|nr:CapA family protein [Treponema sp.]